MTRILGVITGVVVLVVLWQSIFTVHQTKQALVLQFGEPRRVVTDAGLHFKKPFVQNVRKIEARVLSLDAPPQEVIASDQKRLVVDAFVRFRIADPLKFYQTVNNEIQARSRLGPVVNSNLRQVLASAEFAAVLSVERANLMSRIHENVDAEAQNFGLEIIDVRIKRADLPKENSEAIYRRMRTEREREAAEIRATGAEDKQRITSTAERDRTVILAEARRQAEILRGEGDAEANRIFNEAFERDPEFFRFYRSMQAYRKALREEGTTMVLSPDSAFFEYFNSLEVP